MDIFHDEHSSCFFFVVLLNLVISIMGDTFDRVQETQELSKLREITQMIREYGYGFAFSSGKNFRNIKYCNTFVVLSL